MEAKHRRMMTEEPSHRRKTLERYGWYKRYTPFLRFAIVGSFGFLWDTGTVYLLRPLIGLTCALLAGFFVACSINWFVNRVWTYRNVPRNEKAFSQWIRFLSANSLGFVLNRGAALVLSFSIPFCAQNPVIPVAVGAIIGLAANFNLSDRLVFRVDRSKSKKGV